MSKKYTLKYEPDARITVETDNPRVLSILDKVFYEHSFERDGHDSIVEALSALGALESIVLRFPGLINGWKEVDSLVLQDWIQKELEHTGIDWRTFLIAEGEWEEEEQTPTQEPKPPTKKVTVTQYEYECASCGERDGLWDDESVHPCRICGKHELEKTDVVVDTMEIRPRPR